MRPPPPLSASLLSPKLPWHRPPACFRHFPPRHTYCTPSPSSLIKIRSIPAPHTGLITLLTFSSPTNKNAISRQFLAELSSEIQTITNQWDSHLSAFSAKIRRLKLKERRNEHHTTAEEEVEEETGEGEHHGEFAERLSSGPLAPRDISTATRVLVLASDVDGVFCAGADLKERAGMSPQATTAFLTDLRRTFGRLATLPIPTISAVSGFALGGGLELALATSFRVFATTATVGLPETRLGIIPGAGGTVRLKELVGRARAAEMVITGRRVRGREAARLGICERLVEGQGEGEERERTIDVALKMAEEICEGGPVAVSTSLRAVGLGFGWQKGGLEDQMYDRVVGTRDRDEALRAFKEKRKPKFTGS